MTISTAGAQQSSAPGAAPGAGPGLPIEQEGPAYALRRWRFRDARVGADRRRRSRKPPSRRGEPRGHPDPGEAGAAQGAADHDPGRWLRFACGIWTEGEDPAIDPKAWDAARTDQLIKPGDTAWLAAQSGDSAWWGPRVPPWQRRSRPHPRREYLGQDRSGVKIERRLIELRDTATCARSYIRAGRSSTRSGAHGAGAVSG